MIVTVPVRVPSTISLDVVASSQVPMPRVQSSSATADWQPGRTHYSTGSEGRQLLCTSEANSLDFEKGQDNGNEGIN